MSDINLPAQVSMASQAMLLPWFAVLSLFLTGVCDDVSFLGTSSLMSGFKHYWKWAFNLSKLLEPFLPNEDVDAFRQILKTSGGIISGSTALQFLDRQSFDGASDLDVYVPYKNVSILAEWFHQHGFSKCAHEHSNIDVVLNYTHSGEIKQVANFIAVDSIRVIQLVSTKRDPVFAVLDFHSSMSSHPFLHARNS
jgi:hypothetical protein